MDLIDYINEGWRIYKWEGNIIPVIRGKKIIKVKDFKNLIFVK